MSHKRDNAPSAQHGPTALGVLIHEYLEDVEISGRSALTVKRYAAYLETFLKWLAYRAGMTEADVSTKDLTDERLREYRLFLARRRDPTTGKPIGPGTRNLYVIALRNLLKYALRQRK